MCSISGRVVVAEIGDLEQRFIIRVAFILTIVIDKKITKTKTSYLALGQNIYCYNDLSFDSYTI